MFGPHFGHFTDEETVRERLELLVHDDETFDGFLQVLEAASDYGC